MDCYRIYGVDGKVEYNAEWDSVYNGVTCWAGDGHNSVVEFIEFPEDSGIPRTKSFQYYWAQVDETLNRQIAKIKQMEEENE